MKNKESEKLKQFYEKNYDRNINIYEIPQEDDFMYQQVINQINPYLQKDTKILDLGCNTGILSLFMAQKGCEVLGVDIAENAIESAKNNKKHHKINNVKFEAVNFINNWDRKEQFDLILCNHVIEHVPQDDIFLEKIYYSLKKNGNLILFTPTTYSSLAIISMLLTGKIYNDEEVGHLRRYDKKIIENKIQKSNFRIEKIVFLDSILRDWFIIYRPLRKFITLLSLPIIRNLFNRFDTFLARLFVFPATICIHARKENDDS